MIVNTIILLGFFLVKFDEFESLVAALFRDMLHMKVEKERIKKGERNWR